MPTTRMPPDDLTSIDISQLDALTRLEADQRAIQSLSSKAAWRRDKEVEIYSRVVADYESRLSALTEQAEPVRQKVRDDLYKLEELYQRCEQALDRAKVKLQECEFRHEIGEFTVEQFKECTSAAERAIAELEGEFDSVRKLRTRYLEVLPNEPPPAPKPAPQKPAAQKPAAPVQPPPAAAPAPVAAAPVAAAPPPEPEPTPVAPPAAQPPAPRSPATQPASSLPTMSLPPPAPPDAAGVPDNKTIFLRPPSSEDFKMPGAGAPAEESQGFDTIAVASAMLIEDRGGLPGTHYRLGLQTTIGRTQDNQIVVPIKEVSRRHAKIVMSEQGYVLKDLGSPNGTFVNGNRITEQKLREGDKIEMGGKLFIFSGPS